MHDDSMYVKILVVYLHNKIGYILCFGFVNHHHRRVLSTNVCDEESSQTHFVCTHLPHHMSVDKTRM